MRPYWSRMVMAMLLAWLFGLTNASFVWVTKTIFERLDPKPKEEKASLQQSPTQAKLKAVQARVLEKLDPWLPLRGRPTSWQQILGGLLLLPLLVAVSRYIGYLATYCTQWVGERLIADLRVAVFSKLSTLSLDYFDRAQMGDLLTRINTDTIALHRCLTLGINDLIKEPFTVVVVFAALWVVSPTLTMMAVLFLPLCVVPLIILGRKIRRASMKITQASVNQTSLLVQALAAIRVIKAFNLEEAELARYRLFNRDSVRHTMKNVQARELVNPLIEVIAMLGVGALVVFVFYKQVSMPDLVSFFTGVVLMFTPIKKLANLPVTFAQASVGVERLLNVFGEKPTVKEPKQPKPLSGFRDKIEFNNVSFSYDSRRVLSNINLVIPRGCRLGVAGESGSGKSTLANLVMRFYDPTEGAITLDGIDLREYSTRDLHKLMAFVSQEIVVFDNTVAENIAMGRPGATRAEIEEAARMAFAHDFIICLPQGYDTPVGERGVLLSAGQRARLCIARAFVRNAPILIMDEATANLDSQAEAEVQAALDRLEQNRTVICIAHRLSTLAGMDEIIVLDKENGSIAERGTFQQLMERNGLFADMARKQGIFAAPKAQG